jgi:hypothetical protein
MNLPDSLAYRHATYYWKTFDKGYNFALNLISIGWLHVKLWGPKVAGIPMLTISGLPFGSLTTKCHLDVGFMERHKVYYKGEGGGFPQIRAVVSLVSSSLPMVRPSTKSAPTMHQPTCCLVLCKFVWMIKCLSFFLVPSWSSSMPLYHPPPPQVLRVRARASTFCSSAVSLQIYIWVYQRAWECVRITSFKILTCMGVTIGTLLGLVELVIPPCKFFS